MDYYLIYGGFTISFYCFAPTPDEIEELKRLGAAANYKLEIKLDDA